MASEKGYSVIIHRQFDIRRYSAIKFQRSIRVTAKKLSVFFVDYKITTNATVHQSFSTQ